MGIGSSHPFFFFQRLDRLPRIGKLYTEGQTSKETSSEKIRNTDAGRESEQPEWRYEGPPVSLHATTQHTARTVDRCREM